jgi:hypothetical protein
MPLTRRLETEGSALDFLEIEDLELRQIFAAFPSTRDPSVEERPGCGDVATEAIRHLSTWATARR